MSHNMRRSTQVALGGMIAALSLLFLFLTGVFPFATYILPAAAGILLVAVVVESGWRWALGVYAAVSLLAVFIAPDREAAVMYLGFFGFYPVLKAFLERLHSRFLEWFLKFALFNLCMVASYLFIIYILGLNDVFTDSTFGLYTIPVLLAAGNIAFLVYDIALSRLVVSYVRWFRPKFLRKFH